MRGLRAATLTAVLAGQVSTAVAGVLSPGVLLAAVAVTVAGASAAGRIPAPRAGLLRNGATGAAAILAVATVPRLSSGPGTREVLGPLLVGIVALQAWTWFARSDLRTALLAAFGLLVLGASYAPDVLVGLPLLVGWAAALVGVTLMSAARTTEQVDVVLRAPTSRPPLAAPALAAALGLVCFLLVPVPEDAGVQSRLARAAADSGLAGSGRAAPGAYTGDRVDLRVRGELSDEPLLEVPADSPPLWRSGVYTAWDGTTWTRPDRVRRVTGPPFVLGSTDGEQRTDTVRPRFRAQGVVWAPGPVLEVRAAGRAVQVDELGAVRAATWPTYTVRSEVVDPGLERLRAAAGSDVADPTWTALPASVPARVRELGRSLTAGADSRIDAVLAVEQWLAGNAAYRLDSPVPGPGEDAVDRFLFVDRVGFCEQFAAAEVLLLRAAGIPARFVTGVAYGVDGRDGRRTFRQKDLHAWVEVFHPGIGWVSSNPTPPATQLASAPFRTRLAARVTQWLMRADAVPGGRPALAAGLLVLCATVASAVVARRRRQPAPAVGAVALPRTGGGPALQAFLRFDARLGERRRRPAESLGELRARLDLPPELHEAIAVVEQECYAPTPPAEVGRAVAVLDSPR